jgi:hypothetical protein
MARKNKAADAIKRQKEARQKKVLIALAPVLLGLLVWQGPGTLKAMTGGDAEPPPVVTAEGAETAPSDTGSLDPSSGPAPTTAAPGTSVATDPAATPASLPETTDPVVPGPGQLVSFDRFVGKDPFRQQVTAETDMPSGDDGGKAGDDGGGGTPFEPPPDDGGTPPPPPPPPPPGTYEAAVLEVNGVQQTVARRGTFPSSDPIFRLLAIKRASIEFGLVTGQFTQGQKRITVKAGKSVTLVSQPDGQRFVIRLVAVG